LLVDEKLGFAFFEDEIFTDYNEKSIVGTHSYETRNYVSFDKGYSVFDRWVSCTDTLNTYNPDDTHRDSGCFGYRSETACIANTCGFGFDRTCLWDNSTIMNYGEELAVGYCYDSSNTKTLKEVTSECGLCDSTNDIYGYGNCTQDICSNLGSCFSTYENANSADLKCDFCDSKTKCTDYATKSACVGTENVITADSLFEAQFLDGDDAINYNVNHRTPSSDACGVGSCVWLGVDGCAQDLDGDGSHDSDDIATENKELMSNLLYTNSKVYQINTTQYPNRKFPVADSFAYISFDANKLSSAIILNSFSSYDLLRSDESSFATQIKKDDVIINSDYDLSDSYYNQNVLEFDFSTVDDDHNYSYPYELNYFSYDSNGFVEDINTQKILVDNKNPKIELVINLLDTTRNSDGVSNYDVKILRSVNEQVFDGDGNPNSCDEGLFLIDFITMEPSLVGYTDVLNNYAMGRDTTKQYYSFDSHYDYMLNSGLYMYESNCTDLAGNFNSTKKYFILDDNSYIKSRSPEVGSVLLGYNETFGVELLKPAKNCTYNLSFHDELQTVNGNTKQTNLFNKNVNWINNLFDQETTLPYYQPDSWNTKPVCFNAQTNVENSVACLEKGIYYLNSTFSTASYNKSVCW